MDPKLVQEYSVNGHVYAIPFSTGGSYLFYNVDLFKKAHIPLPPTSWDDPNWNWNTLLKDAQALTVHSDSFNQRQYGLSDDLWPENANAWLFGGDIFNASTYTTGVVDSVQANSQPVEQAEQWKHDLIYKYRFSPAPEDATLLNGFLSGKIAMDMTGVWGFWTYQPATFHWAVAPLPRIQTNKDVLFTDPWMMAKDSHHPQQAWQFLQWLCNPAHGAKTYMETSGAVPPWSQLLPEWAANTHKAMPSLSVEQLEEIAQGSLTHGQESINHLAISYGEYDSVITNVLSPLFTDRETAANAVNQLQQQLEATIKKVGPLKPLQ
jgi:multiple sugar transport system substrate-binding protein